MTAAAVQTSSPFSSAAAGASSANDARQPVAASQGRRAQHDGLCKCGMDAGAPSSGSTVHYRADCAVFQAIAADPAARRAAMAIAVLNIQANLRLACNIAEAHAPALSMRQSRGDIDNTRALLDIFETHVTRMRNDMLLVTQRDDRRKKGARK